MANHLQSDAALSRRTSRKIAGKRIIFVDSVLDVYDMLREAIQIPESAPRVAEFKQVAKDVGWEPGQPMTLDQQVDMMIAAKEVTTDFTGGGWLSRSINQSVPFFNAAILGPVANVKSLARDHTRAIKRGAMSMTAATLGLWWAYKDEEWYKDLTEKERAMFWHVPFGDDVIVRIPRPFELGQIFAAMPEGLMNAWYDQDPEHVKEWFRVAWDVAIPDLTPVLLKEYIAQKSNFDDFWERPLVSQSLEGKPKKEQFNEYTTRASIFLGEMFNQSPQRIDHMIRGIAGGVAIDFLEVHGLGAASVGKERELADIPIFGRAFMRGGKAGVRSRSINKLYDMLTEAKTQSQSDLKDETHLERQTRLMINDGTRMISALMLFRTHTKETAKRRAMTREATAYAKEIIERAKVGDPRRYKREAAKLGRRKKALKARIRAGRRSDAKDPEDRDFVPILLQRLPTDP